MERFGHQFLRLIIGIIIARILEPSMFGIVGMTVIFTDLAQSILDSGFGSALIQKKIGMRSIIQLVFILM